MSKEKEACKAVGLIIRNENGLSLEIPAPYCTAKKWSEVTGISVRAIDEQMKVGHITFIQHVPKGTRYINCIVEGTKYLSNKAWNMGAA